MYIVKKELRQALWPIIIWPLLLAGMLGICVLVYPQMESQMQEVADSLSQMGQFSTAFGMDQLDMGKFQDYIGMESTNIMGLLGAMFASLIGIRKLASEEDGHTAELLLTHPISRGRVVAEKLLAMIIEIGLVNIIVVAITFALIALVNEDMDADKMGMLFFSYFIMQVELACVCFGISAYLHHNVIGLGLGVGALAYFLNIISNLIDELEWLKYITPLGYCDSAKILYDGTLQMDHVGVGLSICIVSIVVAFVIYHKKEIR